MFIPSEVDFTVDFFKRLDGHLGPRLTNMSADLLDVFGRNSKTITAPTTPSLPPDQPSILSPSVYSNMASRDLVLTDPEVGSIKLVYYNKANRAMMNNTPVAVGSRTTEEDNEIQHVFAELSEDLDHLGDLE